MSGSNHKGQVATLPPKYNAADLRTARQQRALRIGFFAVFVPLLVLLGLQYWWLVDLQQKTSIARTVFLQKYLEVVAKEVSWRYVSLAERTLNLPASVFSPEYLHKASHYFKKMQDKGAKELFIVSFVGRGTMLFYDPCQQAMVPPPKMSDVTLAAWAAVAPWEIMLKKGSILHTDALSVDERDPDNRIILNPITDESSKLVGIAGMIIDKQYFEHSILLDAIEASIGAFPKGGDLVVCVYDQDGRLVLPEKEQTLERNKKASRHFSFVFQDWKVVLLGDFAKHEQWARTSFLLNMAMSIALAVVLISGLGLTLRTAARELKLSMMKNDFVSNVSHELRTPLSSIRVFGEFMRRGRVTEQDKIREYGEYIESESRRLTQLINNILDFSRIESGQKVYTFEDADVEEVVASALAACSVRLRNSGFTIDYRGPVEPLPLLHIDPGAIDLAICNLLDNAAKYSGDGRHIEVELRQEQQEAVVAVRDHGIGISRQEQQRIFDRFHRVSTGLVHDVKGSGLGLSIVQHVLDAHKGTVTVVSEPGKGSTFSLRLPISAPDTMESPPNSGDTEESTS